MRALVHGTAAALAGIVVTALAIIACNGCRPARAPSADAATLYPDDPDPLAADAAAFEDAGDPCHRAGEHLRVVCPQIWRADWDDFCRTEEDAGVPICPIKLLAARDCAEVDAVCRQPAEAAP